MPRLSSARRPELLAAMAATQEQVVSRAQLTSAGYDRDAIRRLVRTRQWQPIGLAVLLHGGASSARQREWAAILTAPGLAALTGRSAARGYGLRGFDPDVIDVVVPATADPVAIDGVRWHRSRRFSARDVEVGRRPAVVKRSRAVVDAASWTTSPRTACALLAAAVQQRVVAASALRRELSGVGKLRHGGHLLAVIRDIEGGADSLSEIDFTVIARRAGLPPPIRQSVRRDAHGRRRYLDADFGTFVVEVDGGLHIRPLNYWDDARRQNELVVGGDRILRFPSIALRLEPAVVEDQLRRAAIAFGLPKR